MPTDLQLTERLAPGDPCEWRFPARPTWHPGTVVRNGGAGYWEIRPRDDLLAPTPGGTVTGLYIEHVRAPGTDPWS